MAYFRPQPSQCQPPQRIVSKTHRDTSHTFHLIMTICTFGLWLPVWALMSVVNAVGPRKKTVSRTSGYKIAASVQDPARADYERRYAQWYYNQYIPWVQQQQRQQLPPR